MTYYHVLGYDQALQHWKVALKVDLSRELICPPGGAIVGVKDVRMATGLLFCDSIQSKTN
jgi:hypothetical protein